MKSISIILTTGILNLTVPIQAAPWDKLKNAISEKISTQEDDLTMEELWVQLELKEFAALNSMYTKSGNAEAHEKAETRTETPVRQLRGVYTFIKKSRSTMSARTRNSPPSQKPHTGHVAY